MTAGVGGQLITDAISITTAASFDSDETFQNDCQVTQRVILIPVHGPVWKASLTITTVYLQAIHMHKNIIDQG